MQEWSGHQQDDGQEENPSLTQLLQEQQKLLLEVLNHQKELKQMYAALDKRIIVLEQQNSTSSDSSPTPRKKWISKVLTVSGWYQVFYTCYYVQLYYAE